eukprot:2444229-Rhodomonas_salina.2
MAQYEQGDADYVVPEEGARERRSATYARVSTSEPMDLRSAVVPAGLWTYGARREYQRGYGPTAALWSSIVPAGLCSYA